MKRQPSEWKKITANEATDRKKNQKISEALNIHFSKEDMANKTGKNTQHCSLLEK